MTTFKLPGLIDPHVHLREPGATHKEDWDSGTAAAIAGGFTTVLAMPNTSPPITTKDALAISLDAAKSKARCDYGQYLGAGPDNSATIREIAPQSAALKMYLDSTFGELRLDEMTLWISHFEDWPKSSPIALHAESRTLAAAILFASIYNRPIHLCHLSRKEEILLIKAAKQKGIPITCEVAPHHLFLSEEDIPSIGAGRSEVRPILNRIEDQNALWENMDYIDCFATDHAPHTLEEKDSDSPPPGFPGLETALPLLLTAVNQGRLSIDEITEKMYTNPKRIFNLPDQPDTFIEIDLNSTYDISAKDHYTRCAWTPFEGYPAQGKVIKVVLRNEIAFENGQVIAKPGSGQSVRESLLPNLRSSN